MIVDLGKSENNIHVSILNSSDVKGEVTLVITNTATGVNDTYNVQPEKITDRYMIINMSMLTLVGIYNIKIYNNNIELYELYRGKVRVINTANTTELSSENKKIIFYDGK